jgi:hypothetical protein
MIFVCIADSVVAGGMPAGCRYLAAAAAPRMMTKRDSFPRGPTLPPGPSAASIYSENDAEVAPPFPARRPRRERAPVRRSPRPRLVDLDRALAAVSAEVRAAATTAHEVLNERGVPHMLVGGLAVGPHGYPCATQDVDFLVGDEAFQFSDGGLVSVTAGVPIEIGGVRIAYLSPDEAAGQRELLEAARARPDLCVVPLDHLVYMKLVAGRQKDQAAIVGLLKAGASADPLRQFIAKVAPDLLPRLDRLVAQAIREDIHEE